MCKDKCSCGCNSKMSLKESKVLISEALTNHVSRNVPLHESKIDKKSREYLDMWKEARYLYSRGLLEVNTVDKRIITETKLGEVVRYKGKTVPLDYPIALNEEKWGIYFGEDGYDTEVKYSKEFDTQDEAEDFIEGIEHTFKDEDMEGNYQEWKSWVNPDDKERYNEVEVKPLQEHIVFKKQGNKLIKKKISSNNILNQLK